MKDRQKLLMATLVVVSFVIIPINVSSEAQGAWEPVTDFANQIGFIDAIDSDGGNLYFGGTFNSVDGKPFRNCVVWNGADWSPVGGAVGTEQMGMVHVVLAKGSQVYVAGMFDVLSGFFPASHVAFWDGSNWNAMNGGTDLAVRTLVEAPNGDVYVGGEFTKAGGKDTPHIARWDGSDWHGLGSGMNQHVMMARVHGNDVYAGGRFTQAGGKSISYLARWDGADWHPVGPALNGFVTALALDGNDLYVGGAFTSAGTTRARSIARWDGQKWHPVGEGFSGSGQPLVRALYVDGDQLFAGGFFQFADGKPANYVARWDGAQWFPLGSGLDYTVKNITRHDEYIYMAGEFDEAGGKPSPFVARWNPLATSVETPPQLVVEQNYPNPFNPSTTIEYSLPQISHVRLSIYDLDGSLIRTLVNGERGSGPHTATWDGTNNAGHLVSSGVYFYRLESRGSVFNKKMLFVK